MEEIDKNMYILRVNDRYTMYFEALWEIPEGVTYNAYLLKTSEGAILFDGWKKPFSGQLIDALESLISPGELKYVVVDHMEPDHSGSLEDVVRWSPGARVLGHQMAGSMMKAYPNALKRFTPVKDGETLEIGGERVRFIHAPWLHWPETMLSWLPDRGILVSCDAFGGFGIPFGVYDDECINWEGAMRSLKKYVVTVIGHYSDWIRRNLEKLEKAGVNPRIIAPAHGLVWRRDPRGVIEAYRRLAANEPVKGKVLIVYASMYGTDEYLARTLTCKLARNGKKTIVYGYTDSSRPHTSEILTDAVDAESIVIASPTYEAEAFPLMMGLVEELCWKTRGGKRVVIVSAYGWGGVAGKKLREKLESCKYQVVDVVEYNGVGPRAIPPRDAEELAERVASLLS